MGGMAFSRCSLPMARRRVGMAAVACLFAAGAAAPAQAQETHAVGAYMCPCPGGPKPLGGAANCNVACFGGGGGSGGLPSMQFNTATQLGTIFGRALGETLRGKSAAERQAAAEAAAEAERAREEARRAQAEEFARLAREAAEAERLRIEEENRRLEGIKNRLTGSMKGQSRASSLSFKGMKKDPADEPKPEAGGLKFKLGDTKAVERPSKTRRPAESWELYKQEVLDYQKSLTGKDPANKANQLWCKGHVPLSMTANRASWEERCNPSGEVRLSERAAPPESKAAGVAALGPAAPADRPEAAKPSASGGLAFKLGDAETRRKVRPEPAIAEKKIEPVIAEDNPEPAIVENKPEPVQEPQAPEAQAAPDSGADTNRSTDFFGAAHAKVTAADLTGPPEVAAVAAAGPPAAVAERTRSERPSAAPAAVITDRDAPARPAPAVTAAAPPRKITVVPSPEPPAAARAPEPVRQDVIFGNPQRYRGYFEKQTGNTCFAMAARQILGAVGRSFSEDELFRMAFENGLLTAAWVCDRTDGTRCEVSYDKASRKCLFQEGGEETKSLDPTAEILDAGKDGKRRDCLWVLRNLGGSTAEGQGGLLALVLGPDKVVNRFLPSIKAVPRTAAQMNAELGKAREELLQALKSGQPVEVTVSARVLWKAPGPLAMHAVLVTGVKVGGDGTVQGYYVNDTGARTPQYARFVSKPDFEQAWLGDDLQRVYLK